MSDLQPLAQSVLQWGAWALLFVCGLGIFLILVVYLFDKTQTFQTITRNYPVVGRICYPFQHLAEFLRQHVFTMDEEALPISRAKRSGSSGTAEIVAISADPQTLDGPLTDPVAIAIADRNRRNLEAIGCLSDPGRADWPPDYADPFPGLGGTVPEIDAADLTVDILGGAVAHHGLLLVRGLFTAEQVADTRAVQDREKAASLLDEPDDSGWYIPFRGKTRYEKPLRRRAEDMGGNWLFDSPLGSSQVIRHLEATGVVDLIAEHFHERPALSLQKTVLRSVQPEPGAAGWHQDGSFLGDDVRSINVWVALSPCGGSVPASGIELIPRRFEEILPIDTSIGRVSISFEQVEDFKKEHPSVLPEFAAGDALIFDEHLLHRTYLGTELTEVRYALECWFFAPSHATSSYVPFLV